MMTVAACGSVSALTLGLPKTTAVPARKGILPKQMFYARVPISSRLKRHFTDQVDSIAMLGLVRPANTGVADGSHCHEILVLGVRINGAEVPEDVLAFIASRRSGGIVFVVVRDSDGDGKAHAEECILAVCRKAPGRVGHVAETKLYMGEWGPAGDVRLTMHGPTLDEAWDSFCAQAVLGVEDGADLDARILRRDRIVTLRTQVAKLERDHARAKAPAQRNEIYAKLHKARRQLDELQA
ncbi:DUF4391 family protein [Bifidobacterium sp. SMB2]|uniref:DUF4391 family protein n=1 Tax=Bifidobacterium saimiriisciurei TaxID=2661627 RepID=A0ABX0C9L0_9BIFI|nr:MULTISPECIES: DUF4391 domain-containing protein [Bifidobacterium]NEG95972.1 DUF4391 family protein [Bifidobacterium sp. SMB2]NEH11819.1 DUF4391 family protein [Bifidobacterium saimiriisciurei]